MQLILQRDRSLSAGRHVGDTQFHHGDVGIRRFGCSPDSCLCTGVAVCGRICICRIRYRIVKSRKCRSVDPIIIHAELRRRCCLRDTAAQIAVLLSRLRDRDINLPVVGRIRIVTGQENLRAENIRVVVEISTCHAGRALLERLLCLRKGEKAERRHLVNLMCRIICRVEHRRFICACTGFCRCCIAELRAARRILNELVIVVRGLNIHAQRIAAAAVSICIKLCVKPDTGYRLYIDWIRRIVRLQLEANIVDIAIPAGSQRLSRNRQFALRYLIG